MKTQKSEIERVLLSETQIAERIKEVAKKIDEDFLSSTYPSTHTWYGQSR